jgi:hypothetical protein
MQPRDTGQAYQEARTQLEDPRESDGNNMKTPRSAPVFAAAVFAVFASGCGGTLLDATAAAPAEDDVVAVKQGIDFRYLYALRGSWMNSCNVSRAEFYTFGYPRLVAPCLRGDGSWQSSELPLPWSCIGDIGNNNGQLVCARYPRESLPQGSYFGRRIGISKRETRTGPG